jgi:hypothetical protein
MKEDVHDDGTISKFMKRTFASEYLACLMRTQIQDDNSSTNLETNTRECIRVTFCCGCDRMAIVNLK